MPWIEAINYRAIIGGCYFRNIPQIIQHNDSPVLIVKNNTENGKMGIDADIITIDQNVIAEIRNGEVNLRNQSKYHLLVVEKRASVIEIETGKILYDFELLNGDNGLDFKLSMATYIVSNLPIFLHPNRIKIGSTNILKPHMTSLKLTTMQGSLGPAFKIGISLADESENCVHMPRAPMIGKGGVISNLLSTEFDKSDSEMATLMMGVTNTHAANISFQGPCYFLDVAIENFEIAFAINSQVHNKVLC
jgi:hypothetical protein